LFDQTVNDVREAFADVSSDEVDNLIDEAVASVRREKHSKRKQRTRK
jgi:Ribbon-helix-helix domain